MAMVLDTLVGTAVDQLLGAVLEMKDRAIKFKPTLELIESTLKSIEPVIKQMEQFNRQLDRPEEETKKLIEQMKDGKELVLKCNKVQWWNCCYKSHYQEELESLNESIVRFFDIDLQAQMARDNKEVLVGVKQIGIEFKKLNLVQRNDKIELRRLCSPPEPPAFTVGLDGPVEELKLKLLQVGTSVLTVTGSPGSGKTLLAQKLCWDDEVRGKFKDNIFFITFAKTPKLITIVQTLFQHTNYRVPELESDEDAVYQLEHLLKQIGECPMLLVLNDVWPGSESLVENFVFQLSDYKILVTSRFSIGRFGSPYILKPLDDADAMKLFLHSASLKESSSDVPDDDDVKKIVKGCSGSPLALKFVGRSLCNQDPVVWQNMAMKLSKGHSILDSSKDLLGFLEKSFDVLDPMVIECFRDLGLFPEDQRIPASALVDIWAELYDEDDSSAMVKIYELETRNMADIIVTRKVASDTGNYNHHFVTQHDLFRELAILKSGQGSVEQRYRLIIDTSGNNFPKWWSVENEYHISARILSVSTDEAFTSEWCNLNPTEVEVLVLNLRAKKSTLPLFMKKMSKLKVLIITNYDFYPADLENFELLGYLSDVKRIRFEQLSIPSLNNIRVQLKNLRKLSYFMCNVNEAFRNCTTQISYMLPNLVEMNIDYCNMVELPAVVCYIVSLKKLSITNCHKLSALPEDIGKLVNLKSIRLGSCTGLTELPESITSLENLALLDLSDCISLGKLPENMGKLGNLKKLYVRGLRLSELPYSVMDLGSLRDVVCDEETAVLWEPFKAILTGLRLEVAQVDFSLDWLLRS